jgi:BirA family biotin operon repressor/biotin-[acetyl-CoA-carboxylase] ligase
LGSDLRIALLSYLAKGSWVSGEEIAACLGVSRAAVWKQVRALRDRGYNIESSTNKGYRLAGGLDLLDPELICKGLETEFVGKELRYYEEVQSTNQVAREMASGCSDGAVILSEIQTGGKGRLSRQWHSPPGGIWMSLVLKPDIPLAQANRINMAASVAILRTLSRQFGIKAMIKWPNDILINERKLCGILMEISAEVDRLEYAVVGIGINANVNANEFPADWNATSLSIELDHQISRIQLIQSLLLEIENAYIHLGSPEIYSMWKDNSATVGRRVRITSQEGDLEGDVVFLSEDGALGLRIGDKVRRVVAGDCIHLRAL